MKLDNLNEVEILELNIPNGVPIVYDIDSAGTVLNKSEL